MRILMHSYTFRAYSLERALRKAKEFGYDGIELSTAHFNFFALEQEISNLKELSEKYDCPIITADFPADFLTSEENLQSSIENLRRAIPLFKSLGVELLNGGVGPLAGEDPSDFSRGGSTIANREHYDRAIKGLKQIVPLLEEAGLILTLEIHMNTLHDTANSAKAILEGVGSQLVKANLDPGNMFATPHAENPEVAIDMLGDLVGYVHLKNCRRIGKLYDYTYSLQNGDIDFFKVISYLFQKGYEGDICIEYVGAGDPAPKAREDILYLKSILAEINL